MSEGKILSLREQVELIANQYNTNSSIQDVIYDVLCEKELTKEKLEREAVYNDFIDLMRRRSKTMTTRAMYIEVGHKYNWTWYKVQRLVLNYCKG